MKIEIIDDLDQGLDEFLDVVKTILGIIAFIALLPLIFFLRWVYKDY